MIKVNFRVYKLYLNKAINIKKINLFFLIIPPNFLSQGTSLVSSLSIESSFEFKITITSLKDQIEAKCQGVSAINSPAEG